MTVQRFQGNYDPYVKIMDQAAIKRLGNAGLLGNWFVFLTADWSRRVNVPGLLEATGSIEPVGQPAIAFRGSNDLTLPAMVVTRKTLPAATLSSLTCDKSLYRARRDTVRLLVAAPQMPHQSIRMALELNGSSYASYPIALDEFGLCL
ncbi:MAG TPA: hypothetical protein VKR42_14135, partial [Ktedonobacteraceae bacterium]|nr:hypothetical protein [Ktedonobacteraceae bacterium]